MSHHCSQWSLGSVAFGSLLLLGKYLISHVAKSLPLAQPPWCHCLLEYHLTCVPVSPSIPTCCCCEHALVGDAIYRLHPCWLRHPASEVAVITKQGEHANMMQLLLSKNSRRKSVNHLSSPAPKLQGTWDGFVNSICRFLPCKPHNCFLQTASKREFKELPVLH